MNPLVPLPAQPAGTPWPEADWPEAKPAEGVDTVRLEEALSRAADPPANIGKTNALVVVHRGELVAEVYGPEHDASSTHISWSMAKSMLHVLCGRARLEELWHEDWLIEDPQWMEEGDPRAALTGRHLLAMRDGLSFRELYEEADADRSDVIDMLFKDGKEDVARFAAGFPPAHAPDTHYAYSSGTTNILSACLARRIASAGHAMGDYLQTRLFDDLGMASATGRFDEAGTWIASSFVFATARDFARFGLFALRDGVWQGNRLLPEGWMDYGRTPRSIDYDEGYGYGAQWWCLGGELGAFRATGYNGQRILCVPGLDLVIVQLGETEKPLAPNLDLHLREILEAFRGAGPPG